VSRREKYDRIDPLDADLVWSAAFAAFRINDGYFKTPVKEGDKIVKPMNRELVQLALYDASMITDYDRKQSKKARQYISNVTTMEALRGAITEWGQISAKVCSLSKIKSNYDMAVITAMPKSYVNSLKKEEVDARLRKCEGQVGKVGEKIELPVEVLRHNYSAKFNTWFISGVSKDNQAVHFAYREAIKPNQTVHIRGTVKRHTDSSTQLNRVKLIEEAV
jgi:hypothetical protein